MKCHEVGIIISAYLDGEVTASDWREAEAHIKTCAHCAQTLALFQQSTAFVKQHAPQFELSSNVWPQIAGRLDELPNPTWRQKVVAAFENSLDAHVIHPTTTLRYVQIASATAAVVLLAVFLHQSGKEKAGPAQPEGMTAKIQVQPATPSVDPSKQLEENRLAQAVLVEDVQNYFEQVGVLLLEVKHLDADLDQERIPRLRRTSQNLLEETLLIKKDLRRAELGILSQVVEQMEIILLDLANIKEKPEQEDFELLKATIVNQDLLIKIEIIDLKKMLRHKDDLL
jgi:hypothetical protein